MAEMGRVGHRQGVCGWQVARREVLERKAKGEAVGGLGCQVKASGQTSLGSRSPKQFLNGNFPYLS